MGRRSYLLGSLEWDFVETCLCPEFPFLGCCETGRQTGKRGFPNACGLDT